jgi:hypothetical protein
MSDVTAVVLATGEATLERALTSVRSQTYEIADMVVIEGVTPFHRAFNAGVAAVRTPYFVQVDADMVLDPTCVAELYELMAPEVGLVAGLLRDPLLGRVPAVKLFRAACFAGAPLPNTIAPEVDHYRAGHLAGWLTIYALRRDGWRAAPGHTFGEHRPDYTPSYAYSTYFLLGSRYRYLRELDGLSWHLRELAASAHPCATLARLALGHGVFFSIAEDVPKSHPDAREAEFVQQLLDSPGHLEGAEAELQRSLSLPPAEMFVNLYALGARLGRARAGNTLARCLKVMGLGAPVSGWLSEAALAHGVFARDGSPTSAVEALMALAPLLPSS